MQFMEPNFRIDDAVERRSEFYEWVGRCIKRWADLEEYIFEAADWALNGDRSISAIVFFRTPSFEARMTLTSDLLKRTLRDEVATHKGDLTNLERWTALEKSIRSHMEFRNALAHQPVRKSYERLLKREQPEDVPWQTWHDHALVTVQHHADRSRRPSKLGAITIEHMKAHHEAITKLTTRAYHFQRRLGSWSKPLVRPPELQPPAVQRESLPAPGTSATKPMSRRRTLQG